MQTTLAHYKVKNIGRTYLNDSLLWFFHRVTPELRENLVQLVIQDQWVPPDQLESLATEA